MGSGDASNLPTMLKRARKAAGFSNAKSFLVAVKAAEGQAPSYSTYAQWESGQVVPRDDSLKPIRSFHEKAGSWPAEPGRTDLAAAIMALTGELAALRAEREAWTRGVVAVLRSYEGGQVPRELLDALAAQLPEAVQP